MLRSWDLFTERASVSAISLRHILASPGYAPWPIAVNVTWMKRGFNACQTLRSMYPSIFNRFPVIQPVSSKVRHFSTFLHILASLGYAPGTIAVNVGGVPIGIPRKSLVLRKLESWATRQWRQFDDKWICFDTIPACDGQTDRQTDVQLISITYWLTHVKQELSYRKQIARLLHKH